MKIFRKRPPSEQPITKIRPKRNRKLRTFFWTLTILIIAVVGWIGTTGIIAFNNITSKNDSDGPSFFKTGQSIDARLLEEGGSRINTLIIGADDAAGLADTLQIYSIDPVNNILSILSVPRDLYVDSPIGRKTRINEVYNAGKTVCQNSGNCDEELDNGAVALKKVLNQALNIDIHYFVRVDFRGFKNIVDSIDGVTIYVEKTLNDPSFPCDNDPGKTCGYTQKAGTYNMTGAQALKYARCRSGNCGNDFGRAARQQQVIEAIREKILNLGVITNPQKITNIIATLGNHFKTDMKLDEMIKIFKIIQKVDKTKTVTDVLDNSVDGPLKSLNNGQYVLIPKAGQNDWSEVHEFVLTVMPEPYLISESATIAIVDASGDDLAEDIKKQLESVGYNVITTEIADAVSANTSLWTNGVNKYTIELLKKRTKGTISRKMPSNTAIEPDIVLVIGSDYVLK